MKEDIYAYTNLLLIFLFNLNLSGSAKNKDTLGFQFHCPGRKKKKKTFGINY